MNVAQQILNLLLKMKHEDDFKSSFTQNERDFVHSIHLLSIKHFRVSTDRQRNTILTWTSSCGKEVMCDASDDGFHFSVLNWYKSATKNVKGLVEETLPADEEKIINQEVDDIKKAFRTYCKDASTYFK